MFQGLRHSRFWATRFFVIKAYWKLIVDKMPAVPFPSGLVHAYYLSDFLFPWHSKAVSDGSRFDVWSSRPIVMHAIPGFSCLPFADRTVCRRQLLMMVPPARAYSSISNEMTCVSGKGRLFLAPGAAGDAAM